MSYDGGMVARSRHRTALLLLPAALAVPLVTGALASCSSFAGSDPADAAPEGGTADVVTEPADTGTDADGGPPLANPGCSLPGAASAPPTAWPESKLVTAGPVVTGFPFQITTDATHVYWASQSSPDGSAVDDAYNGNAVGSVYRVPKKGGSVVTIASGAAGVQAVALEGEQVYWATYTSNVATIFRRPKTADCTGGCPNADAVQSLPQGHKVNHLLRVAPQLLAAYTDGGFVFTVALDGLGAVPLAQDVGFSGSMSAAGGPLFAASPHHAVVWVVPTPGSSLAQSLPLSFTTGDVGVSPLVSGCTGLWMVHKMGGGPTELLEAPISVNTTSLVPVKRGTLTSAPRTLAADAGYVFAAAPDTGGVFFVSTTAPASGVARPLASLYQGNVWDLAVDADGVYWGDHAKGVPGTIYARKRQ